MILSFKNGSTGSRRLSPPGTASLRPSRKSRRSGYPTDHERIRSSFGLESGRRVGLSWPTRRGPSKDTPRRGIETPPGIARLTILANGTLETLDLKAHEVEDCESIVVGETWHKIAALIGRLAS